MIITIFNILYILQNEFITSLFKATLIWSIGGRNNFHYF